MSNSEEDSIVTILNSMASRLETSLIKMEDAVNRTERVADAITGAAQIDFNSLTSMKEGKDQVLLSDDLCARPAHTFTNQSDDDHEEIIDVSNAYRVIDSEPIEP